VGWVSGAVVRHAGWSPHHVTPFVQAIQRVLYCSHPKHLPQVRVQAEWRSACTWPFSWYV